MPTDKRPKSLLLPCSFIHYRNKLTELHMYFFYIPVPVCTWKLQKYRKNVKFSPAFVKIDIRYNKVSVASV